MRANTRRASAVLLMLLAAIACASLVNVVSGGTPALMPRISVQPSASDSTSLDVRLRWQESRAQRGATVDHYECAVLVDGVIAGTCETTELEAVVTIDRPMPGDTVVIIGRVHAVDSRGIAGAIAESEPLTYHEPAAGPTAPGPIEMDTLAVAPVTDLSVIRCGATWCDLVWTPADGANAYAVQVLATEPPELLADVDNVMEAIAMVPQGADSVLWTLTHPGTGQLAGHLGRVTVREGTCAWPVRLVVDGRVRCRVEGLRPAQLYTYHVLSARLTE